jgi:hypothetical protein
LMRGCRIWYSNTGSGLDGSALHNYTPGVLARVCFGVVFEIHAPLSTLMRHQSFLYMPTRAHHFCLLSKSSLYLHRYRTTHKKNPFCGHQIEHRKGNPPTRALVASRVQAALTLQFPGSSIYIYYQGKNTHAPWVQRYVTC